MKSKFLAVLLVFTYSEVFSQSEVNPPFVFPIYKSDSSFYGPGFDWIDIKSNQVSHILIGEQHGVSDVISFCGFLFKNQFDRGFNYLIIESDPTSTRLVSELGVNEFIKKYPHSLAFDYDEELVLIDEASNLDPTQNVWGVDQPVTAIHIFEILESLSEHLLTKRLCRGLFLKASLRSGEYLREDHFSDLERLAARFDKEGNQEAMELISSLDKSMQIYTSYRAGQRGEISPKVSVSLREELMKELYDNFLFKKGKESKVIVKMGGAHIASGIGPNGIPTLGGYIRDKGNEVNNGSLSLGLFNYQTDSKILPDSISVFGDGFLIDSEQLLQRQNQLGFEVSETLTRNLQYFDALVYFKDSDRASRSVIYPLESGFKDKIILILGFGLVISLFFIFSAVKLFFVLKMEAQSKSLFTLLVLNIAIAIFTLSSLMGNFLGIILPWYEIPDFLGFLILSAILICWLIASIQLIFHVDTSPFKLSKTFMTMLFVDTFILIIYNFYWQLI